MKVTEKDRVVGTTGMVLCGLAFAAMAWVEGYPGFAVFFLISFGLFALIFMKASDEAVSWFIRWFS
jgi:hypothetical protein